MLYSIYNMRLKLFCNRIFGVQKILLSFMQNYNGRYNVTLLICKTTSGLLI